MSSFLSTVKGFTPVIDVVVKDVGLIAAVVYGRVWRYCQMKNRVCTASLQVIADEIGMSRKTAERHIKTLCEAGYLIDKTPERRNRPHIYADAGRIVINGLLSAQSPDIESEQVERSDRESECSDRESYLGKTESLMKIEREPKIEHGADAPLQAPPALPTEEAANRIGEALMEVTFGPRPERQPIPPTRPWHTRMAEAWAQWGAESQEMQRQLQQYQERGRTVQQLGYLLEQSLGLRPAWSNAKKVRRWLQGLASCLEESDGDADLVLRAAGELREAEMTVSDPWSLVKKTRALAAERRAAARPDHIQVGQ